MLSQYAYIAMNRFAYGADQKSIKDLSYCKSLVDAQQWLKGQLKPFVLPASDWTSEQAFVQYHQFKKQEEHAKKSTSKMSADELKLTRKGLQESSRQLAQQTALVSINHGQPLQSRLLDFFSNHFSVTSNNALLNLIAPTMEVEAIAPNLHGSFANLLKAVITHPSMLIYLNNERSIGPNSKLGKKRNAKQNLNFTGLNENLAREILELHTLGVDAGYSQNDVTEMARAITGWGVGNVKRGEKPGFLFKWQAHEPGDRVLLGKVYGESRIATKTGFKFEYSMQQGLQILSDLANHPNTARHLSYKLAKHFIADNPPNVLVDAMTKSWISSDGDIPTVISTLIDHPQSWSLNSRKLKTPRDFVLSSCRACNQSSPSPRLFKTLEILGQGLFNAGSPAGYADEESEWLGTGALDARIEWANYFSSVVIKRNKVDPLVVAKTALGPLMSTQTFTHIKRAESKQQSLALLLLSPEFQRR
ncbi:DUF1800 domain-containing protein [Aliiglaciecola sp. NS0011-25]|uniref:DUF1800 domain-containing protein n=1 Tax=Aliiglaciecola sp. NS0011-25 TaxID=3127654 RepID=UPI0031082218